MDCKRGTFEHIPSPHPMNELYIEDMVDDGMGHIWIASLPAVACFTKATRTFRILPIPKEFRWPVPFCVSLDRTTRIMSVGMAEVYSLSLLIIRRLHRKPRDWLHVVQGLREALHA